MHYMVMLYVIGPIFKEEFKETKTVALGHHREELQGNPLQGHAHPGDRVQELKKKSLKTYFFLYILMKYDYLFMNISIFVTFDQYQPYQG